MRKPKMLNLIIGCLLLGLAGLPLFINSQYVFHILVVAGIYVILTISLNLLLGFTGLFSLGHAAFYGVGAYTSALLTLNFQLPFLVAFALSGLITALVGVAVGFPALRLRGLFLAIGTMGFNEIVRLLLINWDGLTGGPAGLPGIPKPEVLGFALTQPRDYYLAVLVFIAGTYIVFRRLITTRPGRALTAIRDDEVAARAVGINITAYKVAAFRPFRFLCRSGRQLLCSLSHIYQP